MSTVPTLEKDSPFDEKKSDDNIKVTSYEDEKERGPLGVNDLDVDEIGDVFEGPRLIDLGADGKERPIGMGPLSFLEPATQLLHHRYRRGLRHTSLVARR